MSSKKRRSQQACAEDQRRLKAAGFHVKQFSPVHWHVRKPGIKTAINVWPTAGKYMPQYGNGAEHYKDVVSAVTEVFHRMELKQKPTEKATQDAQAEVDNFRDDPLAYIKNKNKQNG